MRASAAAVAKSMRMNSYEATGAYKHSGRSRVRPAEDSLGQRNAPCEENFDFCRQVAHD